MYCSFRRTPNPLLLLLFSSSPMSNFYCSPRRKVYIKSPAKTRLIDQGLYDYCSATIRAPGDSVVYDLSIIHVRSRNSTDDFGFARGMCVYTWSDVIRI